MSLELGLGRGWEGALADPCTLRGTMEVSVHGALLAAPLGGQSWWSQEKSLLQNKTPQNLTWFSHWATVFPK